MRSRIPLTLLGVGLITGASLLRRRYRHDLETAWSRLEAVERRSLPTRFGPLEYAEAGIGQPILVSHGIFHGCDGGLLSARDLATDHRLIIPSRFGYLGSALPPGATGADQADAFVALLDHLGFHRADVLAISAGTGPAIQLALRHPHRVHHLVISSGNLPGSPTSETPPDWAKMFYSDVAMWTLRTLLPPVMGRLMGVPEGFPRDDEQAATVAEMLDSIFPLAPRREGAVHDAYRSNPEVNHYRLEDLRVPTLIINAQDDPLASYQAAEAAARRIPSALLVGLGSGGHLGLGQSQSTREQISSFLATPAGHRLHQVATTMGFA